MEKEWVEAGALVPSLELSERKSQGTQNGLRDHKKVKCFGLA